MAKVQVKVEEYIATIRTRTVEIELDDKTIKSEIHSRETLMYDMDKEGDERLINFVCNKIDNSEAKEIEFHKRQDGELFCIMRMKVLKIT